MRGFLEGFASCFVSTFLGPLQQIQTDFAIYEQFAGALLQGDASTAGRIMQIKGERDRRNFEQFIKSIGPTLNPQLFGVNANDAGRRDGSRLCMFGVIPGLVKGLTKKPPAEPAAVTGPAAVAQMSNSLRSAVTIKAEELVSTLSNRQRGPVLTGVLDTRTGKMFFGTNEGIPADLHPMLEQRLQDYLRQTGGQTPLTAGVPGAHSEINALNRALWARERAFGQPLTAADLSEFLLHNRVLQGLNKTQYVPPPCANCAAIIYGVTVVE